MMKEEQGSFRLGPSASYAYTCARYEANNGRHDMPSKVLNIGCKDYSPSSWAARRFTRANGHGMIWYLERSMYTISKLVFSRTNWPVVIMEREQSARSSSSSGEAEIGVYYLSDHTKTQERLGGGTLRGTLVAHTCATVCLQ